MNEFIVAILLVIGVPTALLIVRLFWYWTTGRLRNSQEQNTATPTSFSWEDTFIASSTDVIKKEHQLYDELNAKHRATGKKCNDTMCGFPECERCAGYKTPYCRFYVDESKSTLKETVEMSDPSIICIHKSPRGMRVFCCDYKSIPDDAIEQLLESDSYTEGYACIKGNQTYEQIKKDLATYCNNTGLNNHYEEPGTYIDYTKHQEPTQCVSCDVFSWVICEWKGDSSSLPRPRDYSSVKLSEAQKRFCESFDRDADRHADFMNK